MAILALYGAWCRTYFGTYYDSTTFNKDEIYYLDEIDKIKITPTKIVEYAYLSPDRAEETTGQYKDGKYTTMTYREYYEDQGYEKDGKTNYYKKSYKYKKLKTGAFITLYKQDEKTKDWSSTSIVIFEGKVYGGLVFNTKSELKQIAKLKGAVLKNSRV